MTKNLCDKVSQIKKLRWQFRRIFRWLRRGVLHFFCRPCFHGEICKTNGCKMDATLKIIKRVHFVLQISPRKHGLQKKWSTPRQSQRKILWNCHLRFLIFKTLSQRFLATKLHKIQNVWSFENCLNLGNLWLGVLKKEKIHKYHISSAWYHCWQIYLWDPSICWAHFEKNGVPKITKMTIFDDNLPFLEENSSTLWRFILCCNIWLEFQMPFTTPRMYFAKKKTARCSKNCQQKTPWKF